MPSSGPSSRPVMRLTMLSIALIFVVLLGGCRLRGLAFALAEQVVVEHLARDRRRRARAESRVLDHHGERDLGILDRREGDEERVVAVALGGAFLVVLLGLLDG